MTLPLPTEAEVHVWHAALDDVESRDGLEHLLSAAERERARRFRFHLDMRHFVAAHGVLRITLGRYLGMSPEAISFRSGPHGKPAIEDAVNPPRLTFNMSEAGGHALYAMARGCEVGADIEPIQEIPDMDDIVRRFFSPMEQAEFALLPPEDRDQGFFNGWTRKESVIKALGRGLTLPLNTFGVSLTPGYPARLLRLEGQFGAADEWTLIHTTPAPGFAGAVAVMRKGVVPSLREWPGD